MYNVSFTCAFNILSDMCFYTCLYDIDLFFLLEPWNGGLLYLQYTTYGRAAEIEMYVLDNMFYFCKKKRKEINFLQCLECLGCQVHIYVGRCSARIDGIT